MILGGIQKSSFIDYPGKISCVLFFSGCNFDCPYCHNPDLVKGCSERAVPLKESAIFEFLKERKGLLDGVVISGGEPTLNADLIALCKTIKSIGYSVKLDTNGSRPDIILKLVNEGLIDYIAMDIKTDPSRYPSCIKKDIHPSSILQSIQVIMEYAPAYEFRTTCLRQFVDPTVIENISKRIQGADRYALQHFKDHRVLHPEFFEEKISAYSDDEMLHLKSIADPWVKECVVR